MLLLKNLPVHISE